MPRRIVIAVDSFKGSISAAGAAAALAEGWRSESGADDVLPRPMADGGEGTLDAFAAAVSGARRIPVRVTGPDDVPVNAFWLLLPPTRDAPLGIAVVELASTSGIELLGVPPRLRPFDAHTRGFGEAIAGALAHGVSALVLGIGSSASTDGGAGMLVALGARLRDASGAPVVPGARGLVDVAEIDLAGLLPMPPGGVTVLSDVTNPLWGPRGAAAVFGPQKGADAAGMVALERGLRHFGGVVAARTGVDPDTPGAGAAGGTGFGLLAWGAHLVPGAEAVADLLGLRAAMVAASLVITGEGSFDGQSAAGKAPSHVAALAAAAGVPVALVAGRIAPDASTSAFAASISLIDLAGSPAAAMADPGRWLRAAGGALAADLR